MLVDAADAPLSLVHDEGVERSVCDGQTLPRAAEKIAAGGRLFVGRGVGRRAAGAFCVGLLL